MQLLQLFMGNMEKLLSPHWEGYKIYWRERFEKLSTEDKAEYPLLLENVPDDLFQLPDDYEEKCFEVSFYTW
ncbi:MAG: hypothetical protein LBI69_04600 [Puniceicoccales bacterium]|nr:hypothetical protein [Puniceicoccales bacterium]